MTGHREGDQSTHADKADDGGDLQAARATEHKPEERLEDLAAVQRINWQQVENEQTEIDIADHADEFIGVWKRRIPTSRSSGEPDPEENRKKNHVDERAGGDAPKGCARAWRWFDVGYTAEWPEDDLVGLTTYLTTGEGVPHFVEEDDAEESDIFQSIPRDSGIAVLPLVDLDQGDDKPGPVQKDFDTRDLEKAE